MLAKDANIIKEPAIKVINYLSLFFVCHLEIIALSLWTSLERCDIITSMVRIYGIWHTIYEKDVN